MACKIRHSDPERSEGEESQICCFIRDSSLTLRMTKKIKMVRYKGLENV